MPDNPPAFPFESPHEIYGGMTLRDYFAAKAMAAMITTAAAPTLLGVGCESQTAQAAYEMADAMLAERIK